MALFPERTIPYKTYIKTALVQALREVFAAHPDALLQRTKVSIDFPTSELQYPAIVIRFFERTIRNAGVGHVEFLYLDPFEIYTVLIRTPEGTKTSETVASADLTARVAELRDEGNVVTVLGLDNRVYKFRHYLYDGDIEFAVFALSSKDRDLISDTVVQTLSMPDMATYTENFFDRIYFPNVTSDPNDQPKWNYVNLNTDQISGFGETQTPQPWLSEDQLVYTTSYRLGIYGEFYSLPPVTTPGGVGLIQHVNIYPYDHSVGETPPTGTVDPADWTMSDTEEDTASGTYDPSQWH